MATLADSVTEQAIPGENPVRIVWALAWPAVALNSLQTVNTLLDTFFVGHLPKQALTAQGGSVSVMFMMFSLAMALGTAATAIVSRAYGAGNRAEYRHASNRATSLALLLGFVLSAITFVAAPACAHALIKADDTDALALMVRFLRTYAIGIPAICLIQTLAGSLRAIGDTKSPMVISGIQILFHITLNFLFIFPPRVLGGIHVPGLGMGLPGAALALSTSAWISTILYLGFTGSTPLGQLWRFHIPPKEWVVRILRIALPAGAMSIMRVASLAVFMFILKYTPDGSTSLAAMRTGFSLEPIMFMPAFGLAVAAAALVGQSLGMKRPDRADRLAWIAAHHGAIICICFSLPVFVFAKPIAMALVDNKEAIANSTANLVRFLCTTEFLFSYAMIFMGAMQGAGDTVRPMWITVIALWGVRVPVVALLVLVVHMGSTGAWIGMTVTQGLQGVLSLLAWKSGKWKTKKV